MAVVCAVRASPRIKLRLPGNHVERMLPVLRTLSNPALGGVISPREFVDISFTRYGSEITHLATSVNLSTHPPAKVQPSHPYPCTCSGAHGQLLSCQGFVRGRNMPCGLLFNPGARGGLPLPVVVPVRRARHCLGL
jgi:hypothetical protein